MEPLSQAREHAGAPTNDNIRVHILTDVNIALHARLKHHVRDAIASVSDEGGLEEHLWGAEALVSKHNDVAIRQLVAFVQAG